MQIVLETAANATREAAEALARNLRAMPSERQTWRALDTGRSALEQVAECAVINLWMADVLQARAVPPMDADRYARLKAEYDTVEKALLGLEASAAAVAASIEVFPEEHLRDTVEMPYRPGVQQSFASLLFAAEWNMVYHYGQVAFIQTLYGDREMH